MNSPLIMSLSPRPGGNSDRVADLFAVSGSGPCEVLRLRDYEIRPCTGCGGCARNGICVLDEEDEAGRLFARLDLAQALVLVAPVYFYHLPSQAKAWVDRAQARYQFRQAGRGPRRSVRPARLILIAGRRQGEKLFAGILPTMRYFLEVLDFRIDDTLCLRGLDGVGDFSRDADAGQAVRDLARRCGW